MGCFNLYRNDTSGGWDRIQVTVVRSWNKYAVRTTVMCYAGFGPSTPKVLEKMPTNGKIRYHTGARIQLTGTGCVMYGLAMSGKNYRHRTRIIGAGQVG